MDASERPSQWPLLLEDPAAITEFFGSAPDLAAFRLISLHADERDSGVTVGFERYGLPDRPTAQWREQGFNAFQFSLQLDRVTDLRISAWHGTPPETINLTSAESAPGVRFTVSGPHHDIQVTATTASVVNVKAFMASPTAE
ncbi:Imm50 family immunity protein [Actinacidiphila alni]|uniref:Imm50 family immunity protein n=1 Tax=Actinacidiphila alni TaxID=380248 RepID=UPI003457086F